MTDERNPQDPELRDLDCGWTTLPGAMNGMQHFRISQTHGDGSRTTIWLTEKQAEKAAHTASQLAGAVPQEKLRKLIGMWRENADNSEQFEKDWLAGKTEHHDSDDMLLAQGASNGRRNCADELESLVEKRRVKS